MQSVKLGLDHGVVHQQLIGGGQAAGQPVRRIRHVREYFDPDPVRHILQPAVQRWREGKAGQQAS